jgi:hypothetical protein
MSEKFVSQLGEGGAVLIDFSINWVNDRLHSPLSFKSHLIITNKRGKHNTPARTSSAYDRINLAHSERHSSISSRTFACLDSGLMFLKVSASSANSNASRIATSSVSTLLSRSICFSKAWWRVKTNVSLFHTVQEGNTAHLRDL